MGTIEYQTLPVPVFPEHTVYVAAGAVRFGVEYRHLDEDTIMAAYGPDARARFGNVRPAGMAAVIEEDGLALHVFDAGTGDEVLRFDCFVDAPHYHFLTPSTPRNVVVEHDPAQGPLLDWALSELATRLRELLRAADAPALADRIDDAVIAVALDTVAGAARYVAAAGRPVRVSGAAAD